MSQTIRRLDKYITHSNISIRQFEIAVGASNGTISKAIKNGTDLSGKTIDKILKTFPDINAGWLVNGEGEMLASENIMEEPRLKYGTNEWKKEELKLIVAGTSDTPIEKREQLLIAELQRLQQIIVDAQAINNTSLLQELKGLLKGK